MNANCFWNQPNNVRDYFTPYNFALGGFAQVQPTINNQNNFNVMPMNQVLVNQYPVTQYNQVGLNNFKVGYGFI